MTDWHQSLNAGIFTDAPPHTEWHFPPDSPSSFRSYTDSSPRGHGSSVASKAVGSKTGVCKNCHLVVLKVGDETFDDTLWAFEEALQDVIKRRRQGKAVILYPMDSADIFAPGDEMAEEYWAWRELIRRLFLEGAVGMLSALSHSSAWLLDYIFNVPSFERGKECHAGNPLVIIVSCTRFPHLQNSHCL